MTRKTILAKKNYRYKVGIFWYIILYIWGKMTSAMFNRNIQICTMLHFSKATAMTMREIFTMRKKNAKISN